MKKDFDVQNGKKYTDDSVIKRGYEIYDEWTGNGLSSRRIVNCVERAVAASQTKMTLALYIEAMSCIFALDLRVNEKYETFWQCLFFYFSWRRESNALKRYKNTLHFTESTDIRTAIAIELQRIREKLECEESDDGDDEIRGGKRNGKAEEEAVSEEEKGQEQDSEEKEQEQDPEEKAEEIDEEEETKEAAEENTKDGFEQDLTDEQIKEIDEKSQSTESSEDAFKEVVQGEKEPFKAENQSKLNEENNGADKEAEPAKDKSKEVRTYNDAVDSPPLYEEEHVNTKRATEDTSFIDDAIFDKMIKGKEDLVRHNPLENVKSDNKISQSENSATQKDEKSSDKNAHLYDKTVRSEKGTVAQNIDNTSQKNENIMAVKKGKEEVRIPLQIDISESQENDMRREISLSMTAEAVEAIKEVQTEIASAQLDILEAEAIRARLNIDSTELGMEDPAETVRKSEHTQISPPKITVNRK